MPENEIKTIELKEELKKEDIKENELINKNEKEISQVINEDNVEEKSEEKEEINENVETMKSINPMKSQLKSEKLRANKSKKESRKKESPKKEIISVKEIEEEISKETKIIEKEAESLLSKHKNKIDIQHKEEFSLGGIKRKSTNMYSENSKNNQEYTFLPNQQMFFMYNPMITPQMTNMDSNEQMNQGIYYYPILIDPTKVPKEMQNAEMFYPPIISPILPQNFNK